MFSYESSTQVFYDYKMRLKIYEIAQIKTGRKTLQQITKTHDGTSSGPLKDTIVKTVKEGLKTSYRLTNVIDENGKAVWNSNESPYKLDVTLTNSRHDEPIKSETDAILKDLKNNDSRNMNIITAKTEDLEQSRGNTTFYDANGEEYAIPDVAEAKRLLLKDKDGEYYFRSTTMIGDDATSFTLIKNNDFNEENHQPFIDTVSEMQKDIKDHTKDIDKRTSEIYAKEIDWSKMPDRNENNEEWRKYIRNKRKEARRKASEELGDTKEYIKEKYGQKLEQNNVKIKTSSYDEKTKADYENNRSGLLKDNEAYEKDWENKYNKDFYIGGNLA